MLLVLLEQLLVVGSSLVILRGESEALDGDAASFSLGKKCAWSTRSEQS